MFLDYNKDLNQLQQGVWWWKHPGGLPGKFEVESCGVFVTWNNKINHMKCFTLGIHCHCPLSF